jgi:glyoxylase-like metal-dependent hydrolase (beta-lactamase superfamily II)
LIPPNLTFASGSLTLRVGKKTLVMTPAPGHSADGISVLVEEDRVLFAGDAFMPLPYMVDGDPDVIAATIKQMGKLGLENIIQGHGDIILRGEIEEKIKQNITYLKSIEKAVRTAKRRKNPLEILDSIDVEACGKSRILLGGLAPDLHRRNLRALYQQSINADKDSLSGSEIS